MQYDSRFEKLVQFYAVFDGIPERNIDLRRFVSKHNTKLCGTIACAGGWAAMHPDFQLRNFKPAFEEDILYWRGLRNEERLTPFKGLSRVFHLSMSETVFIFGPTSLAPEYHKERWKERVRQLLKDPTSTPNHAEPPSYSTN